MFWLRSKKDIADIEELKDELYKYRLKEYNKERLEYNYKVLEDEYRKLLQQTKRDALRYALDAGSAPIALVNIAKQVEEYLIS